MTVNLKRESEKKHVEEFVQSCSMSGIPKVLNSSVCAQKRGRTIAFVILGGDRYAPFECTLGTCQLGEFSDSEINEISDLLHSKYVKHCFDYYS